MENANKVPFGFQWTSFRTPYVGNSRKSKGRSQVFTLQIRNQHFMSRYPRAQTTVQPCLALYDSAYWAERCLLSQYGSCSKCGHCAKFPLLVTATSARVTFLSYDSIFLKFGPLIRVMLNVECSKPNGQNCPEEGSWGPSVLLLPQGVLDTFWAQPQRFGLRGNFISR